MADHMFHHLNKFNGTPHQKMHLIACKGDIQTYQTYILQFLGLHVL